MKNKKKFIFVIFISFCLTLFLNQCLSASQTNNASDTIDIKLNNETVFSIPNKTRSEGSDNAWTAEKRKKVIEKKLSDKAKDTKYFSSETITDDLKIVAAEDQSLAITWSEEPIIHVLKEDAKDLNKEQDELAENYLRKILTAITRYRSLHFQKPLILLSLFYGMLVTPLGWCLINVLSNNILDKTPRPDPFQGLNKKQISRKEQEIQDRSKTYHLYGAGFTVFIMFFSFILYYTEPKLKFYLANNLGDFIISEYLLFTMFTSVLGGFLSVIINMKSVEYSSQINRLSPIFGGCLRIYIALISGITIFIIYQTGFITIGSIDIAKLDNPNIWHCGLIGAASGIIEFLVPNIYDNNFK